MCLQKRRGTHRAGLVVLFAFRLAAPLRHAFPLGPALPLQLWWKGKTCLESVSQAPWSSEPDLPHREGDMLSLLSRTRVEIERGNTQDSAQLARAAFRACSDSGPFGRSFQPFQPQQWLSLLLMNPSPLLFIHNFSIRPRLPCDISSVGCVRFNKNYHLLSIYRGESGTL